MNAAHHRQAIARSVLVTVLTLAPALRAADTLTSQQKEEFLRKGKITHVQEAKKGVTGALRATLTDGKLTHDAKVQTIDDSRQFYMNEVGFKDTYKFNVAAWKLVQLIGIDDMVAPSVERVYNGKSASYDWWIDDIVMDEEDRRSKDAKSPNQDAWQKENDVMQVFDQLIYNMDRNQTNVLIDKDWHIWLIDHGRAFRVHKTLKDPSVLKRIDRNMLAKMKTLDEAALTQAFGKDVSKDEIHGLLARRDLIVKFFEAKGESALYDRPARN